METKTLIGAIKGSEPALYGSWRETWMLFMRRLVVLLGAAVVIGSLSILVEVIEPPAISAAAILTVVYVLWTWITLAVYVAFRVDMLAQYQAWRRIEEERRKFWDDRDTAAHSARRDERRDE